ncbi:mannonate dehydratase [Bacillus sp. WP8]|uniref:mannonate dehydratase n=1 Tax=Bacillus sp. WP8 TaxID=756828 RepID=UPI0028CB7DAF|nr:mannonate dehydratase [Bacillus sp. WP8]
MIDGYYERGLKGYCRGDDGREIWDEECRGGYGVYDRGVGIMYLWGGWDGLENKDCV